MRNFSSKLVGEVGVRICSSLFIFLLARVLGASTFGVYSTAFAFVSLFTIAVDLGLNAIITREVARDPGRRPDLLRSANLLKAIAAAIAMAGIHFSGHVSAFVRDHHALVDRLGITVVVFALVDYFASLLAGREEMGWEAVLKVSARAIIVASGLASLYLTRSLAAVAAAMSVAAIFSLLLSALIVRARFGRFSLGWDAKTVKRLLVSGPPLLGAVLFWIFYDNQDILLLNHFHVSEKDIGLFWSATKVIDVAKVCPVLLTGAFFPALARFAATRESFLRTTRMLLVNSFFFAAAITAVLYYSAPYVETLFYGSQFIDATPILRLLLVAFIAIFYNHVFMQILIAKDLENRLIAGAVIACFSNLALSWWLIPTYGTLGAAYALLGSEFLYLVFQGFLVFEAVPGLVNPFRRSFG